MNRHTREDCWSDDASEVLIDAWGDRYIRLNRGKIRQTDWKEIAVAVNARQDGVKPPKTDVQCKNRIDTLKKKYKVEKLKPAPSQWVFYHRLHSLIGVNAVNDKRPTKMVVDRSPIRCSAPATNSDGSSENSVGDEDFEFDGRVVVRKKRLGTMEFSEGSGLRELARAIVRFGEIYERIESEKQEQMMELEKQRMELTKELELQWMDTLMNAQLEARKMKRPNCATSSGKMLSEI